MQPFSISVIIPAYNEEAIIKKAVDVAYDILQAAGVDFEIIVVNDGSTDKTGEILDSCFSKRNKIIIYNKPFNEGLGGTIRKGIEISTRQFILCVPADSPMTTDLFNSFYENADRADVLLSYRKKRVGYSLQRHMNSRIYHYIITILFNINFRDYNWIHMYDRKIFDKGGIKIEYNGIFMLAEVIIKAHRGGFTFVEFEVEQLERLTGIATASKFSAIAKTLRDIIHFRIFGAAK